MVVTMMKLSSLSKALYISYLAVALSIGLFFINLYAGGVALVLTAALTYFIQKIKSELKTIEDISNACARGDLEKRIMIPTAHGEMLNLVYAINRFIDVADAYIRESTASSAHAAKGLFYRTILATGLQGTWFSAANMLNKSSTEVRQNLIKSVQKTGKEFEQGVMGSIQSLVQSSQSLIKTTGELNDVANNSATQAGILSTSTNNTAENMNTVMAAVEEMTASIGEIARQIGMAHSLSQGALDEGAHATRVLESLVQSSEKIGGIADMINDIAGQVNLLALNATIEAAHAGEAGKGFTVVASEVKQLAQRTAAATAQADQYIKQIQSEVTQTREVLSSILSKVTEVTHASSVIASAVEEQNAATQEISRSVQNTTSNVNDLSGTAQTMSATSAQTKSAAEDMGRSSAGIADISGKIEQQILSFIRKLEAA